MATGNDSASTAAADALQKQEAATKAQEAADAAKKAAAGPAAALTQKTEAAAVAKRHAEITQVHADAAQADLAAAQAEKAAADQETAKAYEAYQAAQAQGAYGGGGGYASAAALQTLQAAQSKADRARAKTEAAQSKADAAQTELKDANEGKAKADEAAKQAKEAADPSQKAADEAQTKADAAKTAADSAAEAAAAFADHETKLTTDEGVNVGAGHVDVLLTDEEVKYIPGKYFLISVPEFAKDPLDEKNMMTSYIRLGASSRTKEAYWDKFLEDKIRESLPPGGHLSPTRKPVDATAEDPRPLFVDDNRVRRIAGEGAPAAATEGPMVTPDSPAADLYNEPNGAPAPVAGHSLTFAQRKEHSDWLHGRGGWRDHSDGNRITTTWGDKVEVIRGNYRMLVLGRQDDAKLAAGWDVSGNNIQDFSPATMPGASVRVEYTEKYDGSWHIQNTIEGVVSSTNFAGDFYEYHWGNHKESITGSELEAAMEKDYKADNGGTLVPRANPVIIEKTWAKSMYSQVGSETLEVPSVVEKQWAREVRSYEGSAGHRAELKYDETWATKIEGHTHAGSTEDYTDVDGSITESTTAASITESTRVSGAKLGTTMAASITEMTLAGAKTDLSLVGNNLEMFMGLTEEFKLAAALEVFLGAKADITLGAVFEATIGAKAEFNLGPRTEIGAEEKEEVVPIKNEVHLTQNILAVSLNLTGAIINIGL